MDFGCGKFSPLRYEEGVHGYEAQVEEGVEPVNDVDERVAMSLWFIEDDEFINTPKFKHFWMKMKMKNLRRGNK